MFRIRGKTENGDSVTGVSDADTFEAAAAEAEKSAADSGSELVQLTIKPLSEASGIKVAKPRKRGEAGEAAKPRKRSK